MNPLLLLNRSALIPIAQPMPEARAVMIAPPPTIPAVDQTRTVVDTVIDHGPPQMVPLSDPRHPDHEQWLAEVRGEETMKVVRKYAVYGAVGVGVLVVGALLLRRPS